MKGQADMLLSAIVDAAKSKGPQYECMAFRLLKEAMTGVAEDLGVLEQVEKTPGLIDFVMGMDELFFRTMGLLVVVIRDSPWKVKILRFQLKFALTTRKPPISTRLCIHPI